MLRELEVLLGLSDQEWSEPCLEESPYPDEPSEDDSRASRPLPLARPHQGWCERMRTALAQCMLSSSAAGHLRAGRQV